MTAPKTPDPQTPLTDGAKVVIIGGGPAGAFFALELIRGAKRRQRSVEVTIIERKQLWGHDDQPWLIKGCNFCAGGISPRLHEVFLENNIEISDSLIQETFSHVWIQCHWKNFPLKIPDNTKMYSVYRGSLPHKRGQKAWGFDAALLKMALAEEARMISGEVETITYDANRLPKIALRTADGQTQWISADFVTLASGVNMQIGKTQSEIPLVRAVQGMNPAFIPARTRKTLIFELHVGRDFLKKYMHKAIYFIEYGSRKLPLEHIALVPKGEYLTVSLIGKSIDKALLPKDSRDIISKFLALNHIKRIIPKLTVDESAIACICSPWMTIRPAKSPFADRLAIIGDAAGSRLYKDGLYSAYYTAKTLAEAVLEIGIDRTSLAAGYAKAVKWLTSDNFYGRCVFGLTRLAFGTNLVSRFFYQAFATELKIKDKRQRPFAEVLWKIASGTADYREIFFEMFSPNVLRSIFVGGVLITIRNLVTELFFGLRWGEYGRYPTFILKEKLDYFKTAVAVPLGIKLDDALDFEQIYAIKIRAPYQKVFAQIMQFGHGEWSFFKLRFVEVKRISCDANGLGTIIRYTLKGLGIFFELRLTKAIPGKTLLYEVSDNFANRGRLIFSADPIADGNTRLLIYTAFDYKKGNTPIGKVFWRFFRAVFPAFAHDVVWNNALCRIKETVEYQN